MLAGPEILIILAIVAVIISLVTVLVRRPGVSTMTPIRTITLPSNGHPWLLGAVADLHALNKHSVSWLSHDVVVVTWTRRSGWVFVVAVFLFPLGLAALLFSTAEHGTIAVVDEEPPATVSFAGTFSNAAVDVINRLIP